MAIDDALQAALAARRRQAAGGESRPSGRQRPAAPATSAYTAESDPEAHAGSEERSRDVQAAAKSKVVFSRSAATEDLPPHVHAALQVFFRDLAGVRLPKVTRVVLFGSRARGDFQEDSDLDLAVVFEGAPPPPGKLLTDINELIVDPAEAALEEAFMPVSPIAIWEEELGDGTTLPDWPFYRNLVRDGIDLGAGFGIQG